MSGTRTWLSIILISVYPHIHIKVSVVFSLLHSVSLFSSSYHTNYCVWNFRLYLSRGLVLLWRRQIFCLSYSFPVSENSCVTINQCHFNFSWDVCLTLLLVIKSSAIAKSLFFSSVLLRKAPGGYKYIQSYFRFFFLAMKTIKRSVILYFLNLHFLLDSLLVPGLNKPIYIY